ncbi:MAG: hypothetical protein AAF725_16800 [Acidobacteriota bacterium]
MFGPDRTLASPRRIAPWLAALALASWCAPAAWADEFQLPLDFNFNGMVHPGEEGQPDAADGFRAISDRALSVDGQPMSLGDVTSPNSNLSYDINETGGVLDILHLGNRNTVDGGTWTFDATADMDNIGVQPDWLPDPDQTFVFQTVDPILFDANSTVGLLYQISNGGGDFDVTLGFDDDTTVTVTVNGPDWFGPFAGTPDAPGPGVVLQQNLGTDFTGAENVDAGSAGATLIVTEAVIGAAELQADLGFNASGKTLTSLAFDNPSNAAAGHAIMAVTVEGTVPTGIDITEVPTLSGAGALLLFGALTLAALFFLRRRPTAP